VTLERISKGEWDRLKAAHLLNRAGFGAAPADIDAAARATPEEAVGRLVDYDQIEESFPAPSWVTPEAALRPGRAAMMKDLSEQERREKIKEQRQIEGGRIRELRAWWLDRMARTKRPLQEKLTLFWHGHFATSFEKVRSAYCMYVQNETFRKQALGNWQQLLVAVSKDPAMLIYLDNAQSRAANPNENYARELMELFSLGEGHYTEEDIRNAARALTGWTLQRDRFEFVNRPPMHDPKAKTLFGETGSFGGEDVVRIIVRQREAAPFIAAKLWRFFAYEDPEADLVDALARELRDSGYELKPVLRSMFLSRAFYSRAALRTQIKSPVQWLIGIAKTLEADLPEGPAPAFMTKALGQELFAPPNVKGWDGGHAWITTASLIQRYNFAGVLVKGGEAARRAVMKDRDRGQGMATGGGLAGLVARLKPMADPERILPPDVRTSKEQVADSLVARLFPGPVPGRDIAAIAHCFDGMQAPASWSPEDVRQIVHLLMSTPQFQLA
jgi:uncharacterized protein (DUF1800 family)